MSDHHRIIVLCMMFAVLFLGTGFEVGRLEKRIKNLEDKNK